MRKVIMPILLGTAALSMVGCVASLCPEDRLLLTQAIEASRSAALCARQAEPAAVTPAAQPASQAPQATDRDAEKNLEDAVQRAEAAADRAEQAAEMTRKLFEPGLRK
jgi:hypothetical protein